MSLSAPSQILPATDPFPPAKLTAHNPTWQSDRRPGIAQRGQQQIPSRTVLKGGLGGVIPERPGTLGSHVLSQYGFLSRRQLYHPPLTPPSQGGEKESLASTLIPPGATKTLASKPSLGPPKHRLFNTPGLGWGVEKLVECPLRVPPGFVAPFSPPCEGGQYCSARDLLWGQFMVVDLQIGCQNGATSCQVGGTKKGWLGASLNHVSHANARTDRISAQQRTPRPVYEPTGRCFQRRWQSIKLCPRVGSSPDS
jgi:hypothetical protein